MSGTLTCQREPTWKKDKNENTRGSVDFHHTLPIFHEVAKGWDHEVIEDWENKFASGPTVSLGGSDIDCDLYSSRLSLNH